MYPILVALFTAVLGVVFWFDNVILHPLYQLWWLFILAGYLLVFLQIPTSAHRFLSRTGLAAGTALLVVIVVWVFDDVLTIYVVGVLYLVAWSLGRYAARPSTGEKSYFNQPIIGLVAIALILLPVSINRILVKLPNLSAGTSLTLYEPGEEMPDLDARFHNQINDHLEIEVYLGSQIYPHQPHDMPRLKIHTSVREVVVRLLSVSYQHRLVYLDLPFFDLTEDDLLQLTVTDDGAPVDTSIDRVYLLMEGFEVGKPVWLQLPHMPSHVVSPLQRAIVVFFRILVWLILCFAVAIWAPRAPEHLGETVAG